MPVRDVARGDPSARIKGVRDDYNGSCFVEMPQDPLAREDQPQVRRHVREPDYETVLHESHGAVLHVRRQRGVLRLPVPAALHRRTHL